MAGTLVGATLIGAAFVPGDLTPRTKPHVSLERQDGPFGLQMRGRIEATEDGFRMVDEPSMYLTMNILPVHDLEPTAHPVRVRLLYADKTVDLQTALEACPTSGRCGTCFPAVDLDEGKIGKWRLGVNVEPGLLQIQLFLHDHLVNTWERPATPVGVDAVTLDGSALTWKVSGQGRVSRVEYTQVADAWTTVPTLADLDRVENLPPVKSELDLIRYRVHVTDGFTLATAVSELVEPPR